MTTIDALELLDKAVKDDKAHPWRICPLGQHFVRTHLEHIPPSKKHPQGEVITRHEHCANNPSHKDMLSLDEIHVISNKHFEKLTGSPAGGVLTDFDNADTYDQLIRGWVRYWNDIFGFEEPLNPNLIKALMATESSFNEKAISKNKRNRARGLLQITETPIMSFVD